MEFRRSTPEDDLRHGESYAENVYYDHHANQQALEVSKDYCHLCWKLWHGFKDLYSFNKNSSAQLFEESAPFPIRLSGWLKYDWITDSAKDEIWNGELFRARCGELHLVTSVWPWSIEEPLSALINARTTACSPPQHAAVDSTTISPTNMRLAHLWLENCRQNHQPCRKSNQNSTLPRRVLDVSETGRVKLVSGNEQLAAYATLSYKWGTSQKYIMTSKNKTHLETGVPTDTLPLTFADAVRTANALKFTYLWIDAICIQQDSILELNEQIAVMGDIYSRSTLTLFAAAAVGAQTGIGVTRDPIQIQPTNIHISARVGDWSIRREFYVGIFNGTLQDPKLHGRISKNELPLFQRGWVLQEEILSSRSLLFTDEQMEWTCLCDHASESHPGSIAGEIKDADEKNSDTFGGLRLWLLDENPHPEGHQYNGYDRRNVIDAWYHMVEGYSTRQLSFASDVLPALSGIASTLHHLKGYAYYAGLWGEDIQLGLIWRVTPFYGKYDPYRRSTQIQPSDIDANSSLVLKVKTKLPSWSWISQFGNGSKITFEHMRKYFRDEEFGLQVIDIKIAYPPLAKNVFGEVLSAKLTVNAITRWAELRRDYNRARYDNATGHYQSAYKLYDLTRVNTHEQKSSPYLAEFWPDDLNLSFGKTRKLYVLCVLCAVAPARYDVTLKYPTMLTAIGVVPSWEHKGSYKRIGLAEFHNNDWFGRPSLWLLKEWELAAGAEKFTLDLI